MCVGVNGSFLVGRIVVVVFCSASHCLLLVGVACQIKAVGSKEERMVVLKEELKKVVFPQNFQLPLSPDAEFVASGLNIEPMECRSDCTLTALSLWARLMVYMVAA